MLLFASGLSSSVCVLFQEVYLMVCLDSNFLDCPNTRDGCRRALALCHKKCGQQCARPTKASLAVHSYWPVCRTLLPNKTHELIGLLKGRCAAVRNRQTKKREPCRFINRSVARNIEKAHYGSDARSVQSAQLVLKLGQLPTASHAAVNVNEGHWHTC